MVERKEIDTMIIGGGGREDAIAWKLRQSPKVGNIYMAPGNGGTGRFPDTRRVHLDPNNLVEVVDAVKDFHSGLVVVIGPERPLVNGLADCLRAEGIAVFGPGAEAAKLEGSKVDAVNFMRKYGIPHPESDIFDSCYKAVNFLAEGRIDTGAWGLMNRGLVIKADGLAEGKGVFVLGQDETGWAFEILERIMMRREFGDAGSRVLIQPLVKGFEVSVTVVVAGDRYLMLPFSEDHKQQYDGDKGLNTGGMGVAAPHSAVTPELAFDIEERIVKPTIWGLKKEGIDFRGVLYPGIMVTKNGPVVLEYNVRFGDPETEALIPILDLDLFSVLESASRPELVLEAGLGKNEGHCVAVTLASGGYPKAYEKGKIIYGLESLENRKDVIVFHAGTKVNEQGVYETSGGRVLMVAGKGGDVNRAREAAYGVIGEKGVHFEGMHFRGDIGVRVRK